MDRRDCFHVAGHGRSAAPGRVTWSCPMSPTPPSSRTFSSALTRSPWWSTCGPRGAGPADPRADPRAGRRRHRGRGRAGQGQRRREPRSLRLLPGPVDPGRVRPARHARSSTGSSARCPRPRWPSSWTGWRPPPSEADLLVAAGDEASLRQALELEPDHAGRGGRPGPAARRPGRPDEALAAPGPDPRDRRAPGAGGARPGWLARTSTVRADGVERCSTRCWTRVRDDEAARQEFLDLLETLGPGRPAHRPVPQGAGRPAVLSRCPVDPGQTLAGGVRGARLDLGGRPTTCPHRALVMGILNRTPDSFYDKGATFELDALLRARRAARGRGRRHPRRRRGEGGPGSRGDRGRGARPGRPGHRALSARVRRAALGRHLAGVWPRAAYAAGAVMGNDISGFADPDYLAAASRPPGPRSWPPTSAWPRGSADPDPDYDDVVAEVGSVPGRAGRAGRGRRHRAASGS